MIRPLIASLLALAGCGTTTPGLTEPVEFRRHLYVGPACEEALRTGVNCYQAIALCPDGRAWMMVTDVLNSGHHERVGAVMSIRLGTGREPGLPERIALRISADGSEAHD